MYFTPQSSEPGYGPGLLMTVEALTFCLPWQHGCAMGVTESNKSNGFLNNAIHAIQLSVVQRFYISTMDLVRRHRLSIRPFDLTCD